MQPEQCGTECERIQYALDTLNDLNKATFMAFLEQLIYSQAEEDKKKPDLRLI